MGRPRRNNDMWIERLRTYISALRLYLFSKHRQVLLYVHNVVYTISYCIKMTFSGRPSTSQSSKHCNHLRQRPLHPSSSEPIFVGRDKHGEDWYYYPNERPTIGGWTIHSGAIYKKTKTGFKAKDTPDANLPLGEQEHGT